MPMIRVPQRGMTPLPQDSATTCWLTGLYMMFDWKGRPRSEIEPALSGAGIDLADARTSGLKTRDYMKAATALQLKPWGAGQSWSAYNFQQWLAISPVWCCGRWMPGMSHNVVVTGASDTEIEYIDPWWEGVKEATTTRRFVKDFVSGNGKDAPGTDFYIGRIGAVMVWTSA